MSRTPFSLYFLLNKLAALWNQLVLQPMIYQMDMWCASYKASGLRHYCCETQPCTHTIIPLFMALRWETAMLNKYNVHFISRILPHHFKSHLIIVKVCPDKFPSRLMLKYVIWKLNGCPPTLNSTSHQTEKYKTTWLSSRHRQNTLRNALRKALRNALGLWKHQTNYLREKPRNLGKKIRNLQKVNQVHCL